MHFAIFSTSISRESLPPAIYPWMWINMGDDEGGQKEDNPLRPPPPPPRLGQPNLTQVISWKRKILRQTKRTGASVQRCAPHIRNKKAENVWQKYLDFQRWCQAAEMRNGGSPLEGVPRRTGKARIRKVISAFVIVPGSGRIMQILRTPNERRPRYFWFKGVTV